MYYYYYSTEEEQKAELKMIGMPCAYKSGAQDDWYAIRLFQQHTTINGKCVMEEKRASTINHECRRKARKGDVDFN